MSPLLFLISIIQALKIRTSKNLVKEKRRTKGNKKECSILAV